MDINYFLIESNTSASVQWTRLEDIHHNDDHVNYTVSLVAVNDTDGSPLMVFNTSNTSQEFVGKTSYMHTSWTF